MNGETGADIYPLLYIKQITNKDLLYSTRNYTQNFMLIITYKGKESGKIDICVYVCVYAYIYMCMYNRITLSYI